MNLTDEQAQAAFAPGSVAVVAGAGTGKTHMLTHRYRHHLAGGLSPLEIVAVTFTERAAAELRARVRRALETSTKKGEAEPDTLAELEAAPVGTLHALAARICRDHPDAAGVPADFGMLDDLERSVWLGEAFTEALGTLELSDEVLELLPYERLRDVLLMQEAVCACGHCALNASDLVLCLQRGMPAREVCECNARRLQRLCCVHAIQEYARALVHTLKEICFVRSRK